MSPEGKMQLGRVQGVGTIGGIIGGVVEMWQFEYLKQELMGLGQLHKICIAPRMENTLQ